MKRYNGTKRMLIKMLKENTGKHMLDSGGANGRAWQKNQLVNFNKQAEGQIDISVYKAYEGDIVTQIDFSISLYHWLYKQLNYENKLDRIFHSFAKRKENIDEAWCNNIIDFIEYRTGCSIDHLSSQDSYYSENTYNGEDILSQDIQYTHYNDPEYGSIFIIQVHGGCDIRGGYSTPHLFSCDSDYLSDAGEAELICESCKSYWHTYDAGNKFDDGEEGYFEFEDTQLTMFADELEETSTFEIRDNLLDDYEQEWVEHFPAKNERIRGKLYVSENDGLLCPHCYNGKLNLHCACG